jgi:hypothetical protein
MAARQLGHLRDGVEVPGVDLARRGDQDRRPPAKLSQGRFELGHVQPARGV